MAADSDNSVNEEQREMEDSLEATLARIGITSEDTTLHSRLLNAIADLIESEPSKLGFDFPSGEIEIVRDAVIKHPDENRDLSGIDLIVRYRSNMAEGYEKLYVVELKVKRLPSRKVGIKQLFVAANYLIERGYNPEFVAMWTDDSKRGPVLKVKIYDSIDDFSSSNVSYDKSLLLTELGASGLFPKPSHL